MPSIRQSIRSSTSSKRPTSAIADGQIALNTASGTPGLFFKDNANNIIKAGPAHYGASAPNSSPAVGGSTGNSIGEAWLDSSLTPAGWKIWNGSAWVNATPLSSDSLQGLVELATDAETQAGVDTARAVTAASLQSKVSDSISTASASGIASSTAVKTAYDLANAALPKSGGIITGNLEIGSTGSFTFEGSSADSFETTLAVVNPTADRTITLPDVTGTVVTTGDTGTVTGTMIASDTIVNADVNTAAAIAFSKLASLNSARILLGNSSHVATATAVTGDVTISNTGVTAIASNVIVNADVNSAAAIAYSKLALSSGIVNTDISASAAIAYGKLALSSGIVNTDISASAAVAYSKLALSNGIVNADINSAAAIAYSKLALSSGIVNTDISASAAIVYSKLALSSGIVNTDINSAAAIVDTKLATISTAGKVSNSATTATNANTASAIVARDASGNFTAGTITAALTGAASSNVLKAGDTMTGPLLVASGTVSSPGLAIAADSNTGFYSPSVDTLVLVTNGVERYRATSGGRYQVTGPYDGNITAVAALDLDLSTSNYFTKTINANSTFTVSNTPASRAFAFTLELTHTSGTVTWFSGVEWPGGTAPTLTTGKTHLFMFVTDDGGTRWRAASLINYTT